MWVSCPHIKGMRIEQGNKTIKDFGYDKYLNKFPLRTKFAVFRKDMAGGDLKGRYPRPTVKWDNFDVSYSTEPEWKEGRIYFNTTAHKLYIGGETGWEVVTSALEPSASVSPSISPSG